VTSRPSDAEIRQEVEARFAPECELPEREEELSPSGRYRLVVRTYSTGPNTWEYSRGTVHRVADGALICDIKRNYGMFHHTFVTKDGREWLIAGRSYMSQTIVDLDRGEEFEPAGPRYDGVAFCWARCHLSSDGNTLAVDGCIWACPYEYRFFDFSDPRRGWPALPVESEEMIDVRGERPPVWREDGVFECYDLAEDERIVVARTGLRREDGRMVFVERWVEPAEAERRAAAARRFAEQEKAVERFCEEDPLYLEMRASLARLAIPDDGAAGVTYSLQVRKWFRRASPKASADLVWQHDAGPIEVQLYDGEGNRTELRTFERSIAGLRQAIELIAAVFAPA
jgi:hypothetical protein